MRHKRRSLGAIFARGNRRCGMGSQNKPSATSACSCSAKLKPATATLYPTRAYLPENSMPFIKHAVVTGAEWPLYTVNASPVTNAHRRNVQSSEPVNRQPEAASQTTTRITSVCPRHTAPANGGPRLHVASRTWQHGIGSNVSMVATRRDEAAYSASDAPGHKWRQIPTPCRFVSGPSGNPHMALWSIAGVSRRRAYGHARDP